LKKFKQFSLATWIDFIKSLEATGNFEKEIFGTWLSVKQQDGAAKITPQQEMKQLLESNADLRRLVTLMKETNKDQQGGTSKPKKGRPKKPEKKESGPIPKKQKK